MTIRMIAVPALTLLLAACGGGSGTDLASAVDIPPSGKVVSRSYFERQDITYEARRDYKEAMVLDCESKQRCTTSGRGWFEQWSPWPDVVVAPSVPSGLTTLEEAVVIYRAMAIINRALPPQRRLPTMGGQYSLDGVVYGDGFDAISRNITPGRIHVEVLSFDRDGADFGGFANTDGTKGYAFVHEDQMDNLNSAVNSMVHEILHALGLRGHPQHIHTSALSYRQFVPNVVDNVPLIDAAMLYDMYGWGYWSGNVRTVFDTVNGVQFGVHDIDAGKAFIPWVDAGYMPEPQVDLKGRATWTGSLVGKTTALGKNVSGDVELRMNFGTLDGWANFDRLRTWDDKGWWNKSGWRYDLFMVGDAPYFFSGDDDGIPDVVGAFYGWNAEVAAGTLQRPEITAAFGAERN